MPPAPGRLSMMNCWPRSSVRRMASIRAIVSGEPPAAFGRTKRTGFSGYSPARDGLASNAHTATSATVLNMDYLPRARIKDKNRHDQQDVQDARLLILFILFILSASFRLHPSSFRLHPSAFILHPSSFIL